MNEGTREILYAICAALQIKRHLPVDRGGCAEWHAAQVPAVRKLKAHADADRIEWLAVLSLIAIESVCFCRFYDLDVIIDSVQQWGIK